MASGEPAKYRQIAGELRARIRSGEFPKGARLPSKSALMDEHHVALGTVNDAIQVLRDEGLLYTEQGRGMFVCDPLPEEKQSEFEAVLSRLDAVEREVQDHARLLARMRQRLETAGISLASADRRDERAV